MQHKPKNRAAAEVPVLSGQEWKIMERLWERSPQPAYDLIAAFSQSDAWHPNTVRTMLTRLIRKGALEAQRYKNLHLYSARYTREQWVEAESGTFLQRVFGGVTKQAMVHFLKRQQLSKEDVEAMKRLLDDHSRREEP